MAMPSLSELVKVEGGGHSIAEALKSAGVSTVEQLLERAGTEAGRRALAAQTGITSKLVLEWVNRADLMRIRGVGSEFSELLEAAGVKSVQDLSGWRPDALAARLDQVNGVRHLVRRTPTVAELEKWVAEARTLPRKVVVSEKPTIARDRPNLVVLEPDEEPVIHAALSELEAPTRVEGDSQLEVPAALAMEQFAFRRAVLELVSEAAETFGGVAQALAWLRSPNRSIGDRTPQSLLQRGLEGVEEAKTILFRLEDGIFS